MARGVIVLAFVVAACEANRAPPPEPSSGEVEREPRPAASGGDVVEFASGDLRLKGYFYKPPGEGPFPTIIYSHGSEQDPGTKAGQARFFVPRGFALFVPHRRGHGLSRAAGDYIGGAADRARSDPESTALAEALVAHNDDVVAAIAHARSLPYVDRARIAAVGCSFGGIQSLLAAERAEGIVAAVDFAGAAIMWARNRPLRERMILAARAAKVPVFFLQAENDYDTTPSRVLSAEMERAGKPMRVKIYPPFGSTPADGHGFCVGGDDPPWAAEVLAFLGETMRPVRR